MGWTVNPWLAGFDSLRRSQNINVRYMWTDCIVIFMPWPFLIEKAGLGTLEFIGGFFVLS
ncbi:hypothetical protein [Synechococcus phage BUCT-ZZ01]|nr:hypothetical protein [Synechococcus phage BUCT-ZZ01]